MENGRIYPLIVDNFRKRASSFPTAEHRAARLVFRLLERARTEKENAENAENAENERNGRLSLPFVDRHAFLDAPSRSSNQASLLIDEWMLERAVDEKL